MTSTDRERSTWIVWLSAAALAVGCDATPRGTPNLPAPGVETARSAVVATLDAWKAGRREGGTIGSNPTIGIVDSLRAERPLVDFEVIGPLAVVDKARPFAVRLVLDTPRETVATRYFVLGQDPLWVFRQEDLDLMLHWEHKMPPADPKVATEQPIGPSGR